MSETLWNSKRFQAWFQPERQIHSVLKSISTRDKRSRIDATRVTIHQIQFRKKKKQ